jgi:sigma-54 dependent transcriptional regulator, acetoin dehydrogenase operon transcriptional activator AcoR
MAMTSLETSKSVIPSNVTASLNAVANEWEYFVDTGKLSGKSLRPVIAKSWLRCRELAISPHEERARCVISTEEIEAKLHHENLGVSGKNVLDKMAQTVEGTGHTIVLADNSGSILYSVGHRKVQEHLEKINFRPGGGWNENMVGPNGIGTTLALGRPELVMGSEHFCQGWQPWVCYGAPIHNPSNRSILGCVDITGPADKVCVEAMALAISITQSIEADLSAMQLKAREALRSAYDEVRMKWPNDASLVLDEYGHIVDINSYACELLDISSPTLLKIPFTLSLPELWLGVQACLRDGLERECKINLQNKLMDSINYLIKPVAMDGKQLGCAIVFTSGKCVSNAVASLRYNEDNLIRKTLIQTGGNISKAARILNIDRTTIYRRRKQWQSSQ